MICVTGSRTFLPGKIGGSDGLTARGRPTESRRARLRWRVRQLLAPGMMDGKGDELAPTFAAALWLVVSLCWIAGVGVYAWKQEPGLSSSQFAYETASSPEKQNERGKLWAA